MVDDIRLNSLIRKMDYLLEKQLKLIKQGRYEEAEEVSKEMNIISKEIDELQAKKQQYIDKLYDENEKELNEIEKQLGYSKEEGEKALEDIMRGK